MNTMKQYQPWLNRPWISLRNKTNRKIICLKIVIDLILKAIYTNGSPGYFVCLLAFNPLTDSTFIERHAKCENLPVDKQPCALFQLVYLPAFLVMEWSNYWGGGRDSGSSQFLITAISTGGRFQSIGIQLAVFWTMISQAIMVEKLRNRDIHLTEFRKWGKQGKIWDKTWPPRTYTKPSTFFRHSCKKVPILSQ